jgi:hypothetical protein
MVDPDRQIGAQRQRRNGGNHHAQKDFLHDSFADKKRTPDSQEPGEKGDRHSARPWMEE